MTTSIVNDVKMSMGLSPEDYDFDPEIILHVNSVISTLTALGVGPRMGLQIYSSEQTWDEFITDPRLNAAKSYVMLCVKMLHDPPDTGFVLSAMERQKTEMEFRLNVVAETG